MNEDSPITFRISTAEEMGILGNAFGTDFLSPHVSTRGDGMAPVIGLLAPTGHGKTTFAQAALATVEVLDSRLRIKVRPPGIRHIDMGIEAYPLSKAYPARAHGECRLKIRDESDTPGFDVIEHPAIPYLGRANAVILMGNISDPEFIRPYNTSVFAQVCNYDKGGISKTTIERLQNAMHEVESRIDTADPIKSKSNIERIVTITPIRFSDPMREAFGNFRNNRAIRPYVIAGSG